MREIEDLAERNRINARNYYRRNRDKCNERNKKYYQEHKKECNERNKRYCQTHKKLIDCLIKLNGQYIDSVFRDPITRWKHTTTPERAEAMIYSYSSTQRVRRYYEKLGVKVEIIVIKEYEYGRYK